MHQVNRETKVSRWTRATMRPTVLVAAGALSLAGLVAATTSGSQALQPADTAVVSTEKTPKVKRDAKSCVDNNGDPVQCNGGMPKNAKQFNRRFVQRKYGVVNSER